MSGRGERPAAERRPSSARIAQVIGIVLFGIGVALLVLPYDTTIAIDAPAGRFDLAQIPTEGRCEAPLLDAHHDDIDLWINYAPESGTTLEHDGELLTGSWCAPESIQRGGGGALLILVGLMTVTLGLTNERRRRRGEVRPEPR